MHRESDGTYTPIDRGDHHHSSQLAQETGEDCVDAHLTGGHTTGDFTDHPCHPATRPPRPAPGGSGR
ncbi:hypothetical protein NFX46_17610 [Streptomyces phaeoluteigriseus]|uniref:DUF397 domain-containing protein n=1 Tax=Streptomyces phaeoluteigriseus TaxID=114686 RepID=A0ABY4Z917_9ACTN|nr:hypothetical protein [Streptomyces phaeoluteigriseus]USQ85435.1 hypothetical protein NFX46_17610 [Streptomyces phaeoluteigriseus]